MEYISGMAMGDRVEKYLKDNKMYTPKIIEAHTEQSRIKPSKSRMAQEKQPDIFIMKRILLSSWMIGRST